MSNLVFIKGTIQRAPCMHIIFVYFRLNVCKLYNGPIRLLDFTVQCIQVESIACSRWMVPLKCVSQESFVDIIIQGRGSLDLQTVVCIVLRSKVSVDFHKAQS